MGQHPREDEIVSGGAKTPVASTQVMKAEELRGEIRAVVDVNTGKYFQGMNPTNYRSSSSSANDKRPKDGGWIPTSKVPRQTIVVKSREIDDREIELSLSVLPPQGGSFLLQRRVSIAAWCL